MWLMDTKHGPQNQLNCTHRSSQTLKRKSRSLHGAVLGPLHLCSGVLVLCSVGLLTVKKRVSLALLSALLSCLAPSLSMKIWALGGLLYLRKTEEEYFWGEGEY